MMSIDETENSAIIAIRHGKTDYTGEGLDLSGAGIEEVKRAAEQLRSEIGKYDRLIVVSSPRARSLGTAKVFLETLDIPCEDIRISRQVRDTDVTDATYQVWDSMRKSSNLGGNYWVLDPSFQKDLLSQEGEKLAEGRNSVNKRAGRILRHYGSFVKKLEEKTGQKIGLLLFTHWEVVMPLLQGIYPNDPDFPIEKAEGPKHTEAVIIGLDDPKNRAYTVYARGERRKVLYDENSQMFIPRN